MSTKGHPPAKDSYRFIDKEWRKRYRVIGLRNRVIVLWAYKIKNRLYEKRSKVCCTNKGRKEPARVKRAQPKGQAIAVAGWKQG